MPTYTATTLDLFWRESSRKVLEATTEQEAIDEAFLYADLIGEVLHSIETDDGTHMSFDVPIDNPVHDVEVLIDDNGKLTETEVPSCTMSFRDIMDYRCSMFISKFQKDFSHCHQQLLIGPTTN